MDKTIRGFDLRAGPGGQPLFILAGHSYAVRRVKCSPHHPTMIASSRYVCMLVAMRLVGQSKLT